MGKHNDKAFQDKMKTTFRDNLERQFRNGLAQGMYAACKVVYDRATEEGKTAEDKLKSIIAFCEPITRFPAAAGVPDAKETK